MRRVGDERGPDQQEKTERQHFYGRVPVDKVRGGPGRREHHQHGEYHAPIMMERCSAMPTAVTTESIEKTRSKSAI